MISCNDHSLHLQYIHMGVYMILIDYDIDKCQTFQP